MPSEAIGMSVQCGQCGQYFVPTQEVTQPHPPALPSRGARREQLVSKQKVIRPVRHVVYGARARSSSGDTQGIWIVLLVIVGIVGLALWLSGRRATQDTPMNESQISETVARNESRATAADPMDFSDLKKELYGDNTPGSGSVGENDAAVAREMIRYLASGSTIDQVLNKVIGPGRYGSQDEALKHLRPYLQRAQDQGVIRDVLGELDRRDAAAAAYKKKYIDR